MSLLWVAVGHSRRLFWVVQLTGIESEPEHRPSGPAGLPTNAGENRK